MKRLLILAGLAGLLALCLPALAEPNVMELGQRHTAAFFAGQNDAIWEEMTGEMRTTLGGKAALDELRQRVAVGAGTETRIIRENVRKQAGVDTYLRYSLFDGSPVPVVISWSFDESGKIAGFYIRPQQQPAPSPYSDYVTQAALRLPFDGEWFVFWGGRSIEENYHAAVADQRFAYDFLVLEDGVSHAGDGTRESDYFCWGRDVLAPAEGKVVSVERLLADNPPGVMDAANPAGNHVILDLGNDEYALLAHLKANSIPVEPGDEVAAGDLLGQCGNSGNTSEPHLHFHLQDQPSLGDSTGMPAFFHDYLADGEHVERGEPLQGQVVAPAPVRETPEARAGAAPALRFSRGE